jgi:hypothetical protein
MLLLTMGSVQTFGENWDWRLLYRSDSTCFRKQRVPDDYLFDQIQCEDSSGQSFNHANSADTAAGDSNSANRAAKDSK